MSHIAFADTGPSDGQEGFAIAGEASPAPWCAGAVAAAAEDSHNFLLLFGDLAVRRADVAACEHIAHVVDARLSSTDSDAPYETSADSRGGAAMKAACLVLAAKRNVAAHEIVATKAVGWINEENANILLHVSVIAMGNTLDHHGEARFPRVGPYVRAA